MKFRKLLAILLTALLVLPLGLFRLPEKAVADGETNVAETRSANSGDDLWVRIERYEDERLAENGVTVSTASANDYMSMTDGIVALVEAHESYAPGTLYLNGQSVFWHDTEGLGNGWVPNARQKQRANLTGKTPEEAASVETISYASKGGYPYSSDVALIGPYYGSDSSFTNQYRNEANSIAQATGGACRIYSGSAATIDAIARELGTCGTVIFDSHGNTDYSSASGDYTSKANTSYLCLTSYEGLTSADTATVQGTYGNYQHAFRSGSGAFVDGTAIKNHMTETAPNSFLWMAICLGMATDGMEAPLREQGVEVVYGYSQSVTFAGDYNWETYFWNKMKDGADVAEAVAYMKQQGGYKDPYTSSYPAYPIVASSEDEYPGQGNVDARQEVYSSWTLFPQFNVTAVSNDTSLGTVSVSGTTITATPATGCMVTGYEVLSGTATATQNGDGLSQTRFSVRAESDCTIRINFARREAVQASFVTPAGVSCAAINAYTGDTVTLPTPVGTPTADAHAYMFYGWVDARVADTDMRPDCLYSGDAVTLTANRTFYALYYYAEQNGAAIPEGTYLKVLAEPEDWSGEAVLTYNGSVVLSANTTVSGVSTSSAAIAIDSTDITVAGDLLLDVTDAYLYEIESVGNGNYTIRMKGSANRYYLCYNSSSNKLSATAKLVVSGGKCAAYWQLSWENGHPVFTNNQTVTATLCYDTDNGCFTCKRNNTGEPLTIYTVSESSIRYTTELANADDPTPAPSFKTQSLLLTERIGVSFRVEMPAIEGVDYAESYMTFAIPHGTITERQDCSGAENGSARFVCYINVIQMAEPITATFHWFENGEEKTIEKTYAATDYFESYDENRDKFDAKTQALIEAIADYGHYMQAFLAVQKGWTLGTDYAEITKCYTTEYDLDTIRSAVNDYGFTIENDGLEIGKLSFSTVLDSATAIRVQFAPAAGYSGSFTATVDGEPAEVRKVGSRYMIEIKDIVARNLSKNYEIVILSDNGSATINVSALSYVRQMFGMYTDTVGQNAAAAFYCYAMAADAYKSAH